MNKIAEFYKKYSLSFMTGITISSWYSIIFGGSTLFNYHQHNIVGGLTGFALVGLAAIPRTLLVDSLKKDGSSTIEVEVEHKPCCDCEDEKLHEEALAEIDQYLNASRK